jgi:hypothetical protein
MTCIDDDAFKLVASALTACSVSACRDEWQGGDVDAVVEINAVPIGLGEAYLQRTVCGLFEYEDGGDGA